MAIERLSIASNPACSGQEISVIILGRNCSAQNVIFRRVIDLYDDTDKFIATVRDNTFTASASLSQTHLIPASTAGAPSFSGKVVVTDFVAGQVSDVVQVPLVIVPPCPALPPPIPAYIAQ
jgi:hypothetical protein